MKTSIVVIGNSKGVRIPKPLLEESGLDGAVELTVKKGEIKIAAIKTPSVSENFGSASETAFAKDWLRPEEDKAWAVYQSDK